MTAVGPVIPTAVPDKFKAPALVMASVPLVTVEIVRFPAVLAQEEIPPLFKVKTDVVLPMLMAVVPAPIFNTPVESSEELLTPINVRVPVVLPIKVDEVPVVLIFTTPAPVDLMVTPPVPANTLTAVAPVTLPMVTVLAFVGPITSDVPIESMLFV